MDGEFLKLGRTWWVAIIIIVAATVMLGMSQLTSDQWLSLVKWVFGAAAAKSFGGKIAEGISGRNQKTKNQAGFK